MGFFDRISEGLSRSRDKFKESINVLLDRGPDLDEEFWDGLEETLILSDIGGSASCDIVDNLREQAKRKALPDAYAVLDLLYDQVAGTFTPAEKDIFDDETALVLFVGINGTGKTTTVGKIAKKETDAGRKVILGSADTFRAAAIEQLEVWAQRAQVEMVTRERGSDPASVCYDTIERAEAIGADLVLIDTAGRLHTSADLMRELEKVVNVVRKRSSYPVYTVLVIDATTGQNGLHQAREFNRALDLDGLIITKLDGTAKGGIALAVSHELELPIFKIGVGEGIDDLRPFDPMDFAKALLGGFDEREEEIEEEPEESVEVPAEDETVPEEEATVVEEASEDEDDATDDAVGDEAVPEDEADAAAETLEDEDDTTDETAEGETTVEPEDDYEVEEEVDTSDEPDDEPETVDSVAEEAPDHAPEKRSWWSRWFGDDPEEPASPVAEDDVASEPEDDQVAEESEPETPEVADEPDEHTADRSDEADTEDDTESADGTEDDTTVESEDSEEEPEPEQQEEEPKKRSWFSRLFE